VQTTLEEQPVQQLTKISTFAPSEAIGRICNDRRVMPSPIGHALAGIAAAWVVDLVPGDRRWRTAPASASWYRRAGDGLTLACAALAAAPDLDLLTASHRTVTHSVGAALMVAVGAAAVAAARSRPIVRVALMCAAAWGTHLLLDWLGADAYPPFGIRALWPFDDHWYISNANLFGQTERRSFFTRPVLRQNVIAVAQEIAVFAPIVWGLWLVRVKALAGLPAQLSRGDHPPQ
jgi:membrane-bound metal-dependent hydrolase YbcI (DUF457 family)